MKTVTENERLHHSDYTAVCNEQRIESAISSLNAIPDLTIPADEYLKIADVIQILSDLQRAAYRRLRIATD